MKWGTVCEETKQRWIESCLKNLPNLVKSTNESNGHITYHIHFIQDPKTARVKVRSDFENEKDLYIALNHYLQESENQNLDKVFKHHSAYLFIKREMRKDFILSLAYLFLISFCCLSFISSASVDDEFKKFANYATEYETGNINYIQLLVYSSVVREEINSLTGATNKEMGGILREEQLQSLLGEPTEKTRWVWSEGEQKEIKLDREVPAWRKIIFDGRKIQIRLTSWPSIFGKKEFKEAANDDEEKKKILKELEGKLVYHLNFEIEFKKPGEQTNIQEK